MMLIALVVNPAEHEMLVQVLNTSVLHLSACITSDGQEFHQRQRWRRQLRRRDAIVHKRGKKIDLASGRVTGRRGYCREVAGQHLGSRDICNVRCRRGPLRPSLVTAKEKQFVFLDRTAERTSKLIALE